VTGWRVGWAIAPPDASIPIRKVHDFLTVGAAAPLQQAGAAALELPPSYYVKLAEMYRGKRDRMLSILSEAGFRCFKPAGAYYVMTDIESFGYPDDLSFSKYLVEKIGIAVVPGSSFYYNPEMGARQVRFTFCKKESTLDACEEKLSKLRHA
jgi:aminotransferase